MNSKNRVNAVFERKKLDRTPIDLGGTRKTGISVTALYHLRQCLGAEIPARLYDIYEGTAELDMLVQDTLGGDTLPLPLAVPLLTPECFCETAKKAWKPYAMEDGIGVLIPRDFYPERELSGDLCLRDFQDRRFGMMKRGGWRFELLAPGPGVCGLTFAEIEKELGSENPAVAFLQNSESLEILKTNAKKLARSSKKSLILRAGLPSPFFGGLGFREPEKWLRALDSGHSDVEKLLEKWYSLWISELKKLHEAAGEAVNVLVLEESFLGVETDADRRIIRERILPLYARGIREIRELFSEKVHILWQAEGDSMPFLPQLIEMGVEGISFTDGNSGMDPLTVKREFGKELVLWGGACSAQELVSETAAAILSKTQERTAILSENGGYIHAVSGTILPSTDPENILTFFLQKN